MGGFRAYSWNVNGIRSAIGKGFGEFFAQVQPDVLCLQEVKAFAEQVDLAFPGYRVYWNSAAKPGYSGTVTFSRREPISVSRGMGVTAHDSEGRLLTLEFKDFFLVNVYTPNSQRGLTRLDYRVNHWDRDFFAYLAKLEKTKPVVFCGDLNVAHQEIDLANPKSNTRNAGFTIEERRSFERYLEAGFVDSFRAFEKGGGHYSWWSARPGVRERNIGWRIDYFCVSGQLNGGLTRADIHPEVRGSDHCPVSVELDV